MGDDIKPRAYMRGEVKNAKAEELLAFIKAEREVEEIEKNVVPSTLKKRPLLPAIKAEEESENTGLDSRLHGRLIPETLASFIHNIPVKNKSKFVWRDHWDLAEDANNSRQIRNRRRSSESLLLNNNSSTDIAPKNLPPLRTRLSNERPCCPEPPMTPPFENNSHAK